MNKKLAAFFICSIISLVNSTPIDSADNANLSTGGGGQYEVTPFPAETVPPGLVGHRVGEITSSGKSERPSSMAAGTNAPEAVSFVSQPVTTPSLVAQNTNATVTAVTVPSPTVPITKVPTPSVPTLPPIAPTTTNATDIPTTTTLPPTTTPATTTPPATNTTTAATTTSTTTNSTTLPTPVTTSGTTPAAVTTTPAPGPTPAPSKDRRFDGPSFVGGIVLSLGIMAIGFVAWKFYKARTERNYHTL